MIAKCWEYGNAREFFRHLFDRFLDDFHIFLFCLVPDVVRHQITGPNDVINVLYSIWEESVFLNLVVVHIGNA